jgi:hypothetical protein
VVYGSASFVAPTQANNLVLPALGYGYSFRMYDGQATPAEVTTAPAGTSFAASWAQDSSCVPPGAVNLPSGTAAKAPTYANGKWTWNLVVQYSGCQKLTVKLNDGWTTISTLTFA